jgi:hypothetical protein
MISVWLILHNPANKIMFISTRINPRGIAIFNIKGQKLLHKKMAEPDQELSIAGLAPGFYFVRILARDGQFYNQSLLKQ